MMLRKMCLFIFFVLIIAPLGSAVLDDAAAAWTYDDADTSGATMTDVSGNNNDATLEASPTTGVNGILQEAYDFDSGSSQYLDLVDTASLDISGNVTISFWVNVSSVGTQQIVYSNANSGSHKVQQMMQIVGGSLYMCESDSGSTTSACDTSSLGALVNQWVHVVGTHCGGTLYTWVNGVESGGTAAPGTQYDASDLDIGARYSSGTAEAFINGLMDMGLVYDRCLSDAEIGDLYNSGNGLNPYYSDVAVTILSPPDNDHTNDFPLNISYQLNTSSSTNCSLVVDGTTNSTATGLSEGDYSSLSYMSEGSHTYYYSCFDGSQEFASNNRTVVIDQSAPDFTIHPNNFFKTDNSSVLNVHSGGDDAQWNITIDDTYLFAFQILAVDASGTTRFNYTRTDLATAEEQITNVTNYGGWAEGVANITLYAEDDHTANEIGAYASSSVAEGRTWTTEDGILIKITSPGSLISTAKLRDRYTFRANYSSPRSQSTYVLHSSKPLFYRGDLYPFPSFVTGKNWVDFNTANLVGSSVKMLREESGFYRYEVVVTHAPSRSIEYRSLGGLNSRTENYQVLVNNTPAQNENISLVGKGTGYIAIDWDKRTGTNATEVYQDGVNVLNTTGTSYNATGLSPGTSYTFTVYARNGTKLNTSVSAENQITLQTNFNTTAQMSLFNEQTQTLIAQFSTVTFISGVENTTLNSTSGEFSLTSISPASYILRHESEGYGVRDQYITVTNSSNQTVDLYLLSENVSVFLPVKVVDLQAQPVVGAVLHWQRFYSSSSTYTTVEMATSGDNGLLNVYYEPYDAWYVANVYYQGSLKKTTTPSRYSLNDASAGITIPIDVSEDYLDSLPGTLAIMANDQLTYSPASRLYTYTYSDPDGVVSEVCLNVYEFVLNRVKTLRNSTCSTAQSATLLAVHDATNNTVVGEATLQTNTEHSFRILGILEYLTNPNTAFRLIGGLAVFIAIIVVTFISFLYTENPVVTIILFCTGLIGMSALTFIGWNWGTVILITLLGGALAILMSWRGRV